MQRLSQLAEIGREGRAGAHRPGLSAAEQEACELVATWLRQEGLEVSWDACGNLYGRLAGSDPAAGEIWSGSHLDTVPNGGRFDGALGVLAALEAVAQLRDAVAGGHALCGRVPGRGGLAVRRGLLRQPLPVRHRDRGRPAGDRRRRRVDRRGAGGARLPGAARRWHAAGRIRRGAHRAGPGAGATGAGTRGRHLDRGHVRLHRDDHRQPRPRRHHAHGGPPRRTAGRRRAGARAP